MERQVLTKVERLPKEAQKAVQNAYDGIIEKRATQMHLMAELNEALLALGIEAIPFSSFNRWSIKIRNGEVLRPGSRAAANQPQNKRGTLVSPMTLSLFAQTLRSLADDLDPAR
ncbi:DUF3486 family protein [Mesorhizobium sp. B2-4-4]|uniref:DUF3486 family protein n=1 Tax=Mesorhizobium sp. B2-4-4 TaxID=2589945 RepID=UPI00112D4251|nr:DUF3486 family protein [Mesorhizobium sp. B2-4-4]TPL49132.1 DUF3486 family protein [Mesorhizobium sp. B2-4-4]